MTRRRKWQSGTVDLVSVAVGMVILSIAVAGTSAAMIYGRDILMRQEHYKAVAYLLRGEMEKKQWELVGVIQVDDDRAFGSKTQYTDLNTSTEHGRGSRVIRVTIVQQPILKHFDNSGILDYYYLTMYATWAEPTLAGADRGELQERQIKFSTAVARRGA
jgi:hypothetical protein